jgi:heme A synthase
MSARTESQPVTTAPTGRSTLFSALVGLAALAVLLQALWAGIFLEHDGGRDAAAGWIDVHARGGEAAIVLALAATIVAFIKLRDRKDLWIGSAALTVLLILESYLGGLIRDDSKDTLTAVHVPLAMTLMALVIWLPLRARRAG